MTAREARIAVRRGAKLLDKKVGRSWRRKIRRRRLDLASASYYVEGTKCGCILAQLDARDGYGSYSRMAGMLGLRGGQSYRYGFNLLGENVSEEAYALLTEAWKEELRR